jgi:hypothetical protein
MTLLRHTNIRTTLEIYADVGDIDTSDALRKAWS